MHIVLMAVARVLGYKVCEQELLRQKDTSVLGELWCLQCLQSYCAFAASGEKMGCSIHFWGTSAWCVCSLVNH